MNVMQKLTREDLFSLEQYAEARDAYALATQADPDSVHAWAGLGDSLRQLGEYAEATQAYLEAIALDPDDANLRLALALLYEKRGDLDAAIEAYETALVLADSALGHAALASAHQRKGDLANAAYWYRRAGRDSASADLEAEWAEIVAGLPDDGGG